MMIEMAANESSLIALRLIEFYSDWPELAIRSTGGKVSGRKRNWKTRLCQN
jgi:hypothetical protein